MGQNGSTNSNPMLSDWSQNKNEPNIYTNLKTGEQVQRFIVAATPEDQLIYRKRMKEQHNFILKVHYYQINSVGLKNNSKQTMNVYTDRFLPINKDKWHPTTTALSILKGFRRLSTPFGLMRVTPEMIGMNQRDELKVWINKNPALNEPIDKAINEEQMLTDITKIIVQYDKEAVGLLIGCFTLNQAVNNMIVSMGQNKNQPNLSSRTARGQQRQVFQKGQISTKINNNNLFRSTKQTQDQFPKPLYNNQKRPEEKSSQINIQTSKYLMNVHLPQSPKYVSFGNQTEKKKNFSGYQTYKTMSGQNNERTIPVLNNSQKIGNKQITNIQFNSSNQERKPDLLSKKPYRGVEHKIASHQHIGATSSIIAYTSNQRHHKPEDNYKEKSPEYSMKNENILKKNTSGPEIHYLERKSDLTRENLIGREEGRVSDFYMVNQSSKLKIQAHEKSVPDKKNNSRDIPFYYPPQREDINTKNVPKQNYKSYNFKQGQLRFETGEPRTKTQQFTSNMYVSEDNSWNSYGSQKYPRKKAQAYDKNLNYNPSDINFNKKKITGNSTKNNQGMMNTIDLVGSTKIQVIEDDKLGFYGSSIKNRQYTGKLQKIRSNPNVSNPQPKIEKDETLYESGSNNYEERKVKKQELSKKIKAQISGLLLLSKDGPDSEDQKQHQSSKQISNKDKKIVQKIKEKQAAFANLKTQAMKVLMGQ